MQTGVGIAQDPVARAARPTAVQHAGGTDGRHLLRDGGMDERARRRGNGFGARGDLTVSGSSFAVRAATRRRTRRAGMSTWADRRQRCTLQNPAPMVLEQTWMQPEALATAGGRRDAGRRPTICCQFPDDSEGVMTTKIGSAATGKVLQRITGPTG